MEFDAYLVRFERTVQGWSKKELSASLNALITDKGFVIFTADGCEGGEQARVEVGNKKN